MPATVRIAHVSDPHVFVPGALRPGHLLGKRLLGGMNLLGMRRRIHRGDVVEALVRDLLAQNLDHVVVTGDLSNLSLEEEFEQAKRLLTPLDGIVSVVPGNHDLYVRAAAGRFEAHFERWIRSDLDPFPGHPYPFVRLVGHVAVVGLGSARPTPWGFSSGRLGLDQLDRLDRLLDHPEVSKRYKVVCLHHPILDRPEVRFHKLRRLDDEAMLRPLLLEHHVGMVLHGHNHLVHEEHLIGPDGWDMAVHTATSCSLVAGPRERRARYAIWELTEGAAPRARWRAWDGHGWVAQAADGGRVPAMSPTPIPVEDR